MLQYTAWHYPSAHPPLARNLPSMMQLPFLKWLSWPTLIRPESSVDLLDQCPTESPTRMWGKEEMQQSNDLNHDRFLERTRIEFSFFNDYGTISLLLFSASRNFEGLFGSQETEGPIRYTSR